MFRGGAAEAVEGVAFVFAAVLVDFPLGDADDLEFGHAGFNFAEDGINGFFADLIGLFGEAEFVGALVDTEVNEGIVGLNEFDAFELALEAHIDGQGHDGIAHEAQLLEFSVGHGLFDDVFEGGHGDAGVLGVGGFAVFDHHLDAAQFAAAFGVGFTLGSDDEGGGAGGGDKYAGGFKGGPIF